MKKKITDDVFNCISNINYNAIFISFNNHVKDPSLRIYKASQMHGISVASVLREQKSLDIILLKII